MYLVLKKELCLKYVAQVFFENVNVKSPCNFQSLGAVDRGSETQLQVTENLIL